MCVCVCVCVCNVFYVLINVIRNWIWILYTSLMLILLPDKLRLTFLDCVGSQGEVITGTVVIGMGIQVVFLGLTVAGDVAVAE